MSNQKVRSIANALHHKGSYFIKVKGAIIGIMRKDGFSWKFSANRKSMILGENKFQALFNLRNRIVENFSIEAIA